MSTVGTSCMRLEEEIYFVICSRVDLVLAKILFVFTVFQKTPFLSLGSRIYVKNGIMEYISTS